MHGQNDPRVHVPEVEAIFAALPGPKALKIFAGLGHQSYAEARPEEWRKEVQACLTTRAERH